MAATPPPTDTTTTESSSSAGPPHEALFLVLPYLSSVLDLLSVSRVCSQLRVAVADDVLPWMDLVVDGSPLNRRLSNQSLIGLASRGKGMLRSLTLVDCFNVTDDGLQSVISNNPLITKLHVPGCWRLTAEGIIRATKTLSENQTSDSSLKSLEINNIHDITKQHYQTLCSYLEQQGTTDYHIDVEICPMCDQVRRVYECPTRPEFSAEQSCYSRRGCKLCVARCEECRRCAWCADDEMLDEEASLCAEVWCSRCWLLLSKCDHCNKPYCAQHADRMHRGKVGQGWLCEACLVEAEANC
ncbi:F-box protein SKIP28 [Linum grandiflorum]